MPARLPDEELAPVEGATPSQAAVQPSTLGLNVAAEPMASAATVGYRAQLFQERAKAVEDAKAVAPAVSDITGKLAVDLANRSQNYDSPNFIADAKDGAQGIIEQGKIDAGYAKWDPGRQGIFDRAIQGQVDQHNQQAYGVQSHYIESALAKGRDDQQLATSQSQVQPVTSAIAGLEYGQATTNAGDPQARSQYISTAQGLANDHWQNEILPQLTAANTPADQIAAYKGMYDSKIASEITEGASRIGIAQVAFQGDSTAKTALGNIAGLEAQVFNNPAAMTSIAQPGGTLAQYLKPVGTGKLAEDTETTAKKGLALNWYKGMLANGDVEHAQAAFSSGQYTDWLGDDGVKEVAGELAKNSPAAYAKATDVATLRLQLQANMGAVASEGTGFISAADVAKTGDVGLMAEYNASVNYAHDVFAANGGAPLSQQRTDVLQRMAPPGDPRDPKHEAEVAAWNARNQVLQQRQGDIVGYLKGTDAKGATPTKGVAEVGRGANQGSVGDRVTDLYNQFAQTGDPAAARAYVGYVVQSQHQLDPKNWQATGHILSKADAASWVAPILNGPLEQRTAAFQSVMARVNAVNGQYTLPDGTRAPARQMLLRDLQGAGLTPGEAAAITYLRPGSAALGYYSAGISKPELKQEMDGPTAKNLWSTVDTQLAPYNATATSPANQELRQGLRDMTFAASRYLLEDGPAGIKGNAQAAVAKVVGSLTEGQTFQSSYRMPTALATQSYTSHSYKTPGGTSTPVTQSGARWVSTGLGLATQHVLGKDSLGQVGGNLMLPPHSDFPAAQTLTEWAGIIRQGGRWQNVDDDHVALKIQRTDGQWDWVQDKNGHPFILPIDQARRDGMAGKSSFDAPTPPQATISTPGGNPVNYAHPPVVAAAVAHAMVHGPVGPAGGLKVQVDPGAAPPAVAFGKPSAAEGAPASPPGGAPSVGDYSVDSDAKTAAGAPGAAGAPAPPAGDNATQRMLRSMGVADRTIGLFGSPEYGGPAPAPGQPPPAPAFPDGLPRMNVKPSEYVKILQPVVQAAESSGPGQVSSAGAVGRMQLEDGVIHDYAPKLGIPADKEYLRTHDAPNIAIGTAYLNDLTSHFMQGRNPMAGIAMAIAAYNAGPRTVEGGSYKGVYHAGLIQKIGDPRAGTMTPEEWIQKIPDKAVRDYTWKIYEATASRLAPLVGAGPAQGGR